MLNATDFLGMEAHCYYTHRSVTSSWPNSIVFTGTGNSKLH